MVEMRILEKGNVYFFYRPKVDREEAHGIEDVQRFYILLSPENKKGFRLLIVGEKELPEEKSSGKERKNWAFVKLAGNLKKMKDEIAEDKYQTKTKGERIVEAARPVGEGRYAIVQHEKHNHFLYELDTPKKIGKVQREFNISKEENYIVTVKNPEVSSPKGVGLEKEQKAKLPKKLKDKFENKRFIPLEPEFLDYEGSEIVMIETDEEVPREIQSEINKNGHGQNILEKFNIWGDRKRPLVEGKWK